MDGYSYQLGMVHPCAPAPRKEGLFPPHAEMQGYPEADI